MVIRLLKECAQWMKDGNIDQWRFLLEVGEDTEFKYAIERKDTFIVM
ncbi:hypothetical protein [Fictibacillus phosphorivorans]|nr:hypothetical protein [Fictibacillus phosphorivorans]